MQLDDRFRPDPALDREAKLALQAEIADAATFDDQLSFDHKTIGTGTDEPLIAGVDQSFPDDRVVSAIVVLRGDTVVERTYSVTEQSFPYVPGLLSFREGGPIVSALETLEITPDLLVFDGSGRIHYREAGLAVHLGVAFDLPAIGVAKSLLCGTPERSTDSLHTGESVPIRANDEMSTPNGTTVGYALQTRQYENNHRINPVYVSPGHRLSAATATEIIDQCGGEYKLPEPTRLADRYADHAKELEI
ncbi:endonuclease V [Halocatena halophila]|uniref:endonuclease V n=1 Tax=Halocatena halophila TaxID=2814576 RepID=UPI002ED2305D